jgi:hypothetical protein
LHSKIAPILRIRPAQMQLFPRGSGCGDTFIAASADRISRNSDGRVCAIETAIEVARTGGPIGISESCQRPAGFSVRREF